MNSFVRKNRITPVIPLMMSLGYASATAINRVKTINTISVSTTNPTNTALPITSQPLYNKVATKAIHLVRCFFTVGAYPTLARCLLLVVRHGKGRVVMLLPPAELPCYLFQNHTPYARVLGKPDSTLPYVWVLGKLDSSLTRLRVREKFSGEGYLAHVVCLLLVAVSWVVGLAAHIQPAYNTVCSMGKRPRQLHSRA